MLYKLGDTILDQVSAIKKMQSTEFKEITTKPITDARRKNSIYGDESKKVDKKTLAPLPDSYYKKYICLHNTT